MKNRFFNLLRENLRRKVSILTIISMIVVSLSPATSVYAGAKETEYNFASEVEIDDALVDDEMFYIPYKTIEAKEGDENNKFVFKIKRKSEAKDPAKVKLTMLDITGKYDRDYTIRVIDKAFFSENVKNRFTSKSIDELAKNKEYKEYNITDAIIDGSVDADELEEGKDTAEISDEDMKEITDGVNEVIKKVRNESRDQNNEDDKVENKNNEVENEVANENEADTKKESDDEEITKNEADTKKESDDEEITKNETEAETEAKTEAEAETEAETEIEAKETVGGFTGSENESGESESAETTQEEESESVETTQEEESESVETSQSIDESKNIETTESEEETSVTSQSEEETSATSQSEEETTTTQSVEESETSMTSQSVEESETSMTSQSVEESETSATSQSVKESETVKATQSEIESEEVKEDLENKNTNEKTGKESNEKIATISEVAIGIEEVTELTYASDSEIVYGDEKVEFTAPHASMSMARGYEIATGLTDDKKKLTPDRKTDDILGFNPNSLENPAFGAEGTEDVMDSLKSAYVILDFKMGQTEKLIEITIKDDKKYRGDRQVGFNITPMDGSVVAGMYSSITLTIKDDEKKTPTYINFTKKTYSPKDGYITIEVERSGDLSSIATCMVDTYEETAKEGKDYSKVHSKLIFGFGINKRTFKIPIVSNYIEGDTVTFRIKLQEAIGALIGDKGEAICKISKNDKKSKVVDEKIKEALTANNNNLLGSPMTADSTGNMLGAGSANINSVVVGDAFNLEKSEIYFYTSTDDKVHWKPNDKSFHYYQNDGKGFKWYLENKTIFDHKTDLMYYDAGYDLRKPNNDTFYSVAGFRFNGHLGGTANAGLNMVTNDQSFFSDIASKKYLHDNLNRNAPEWP